MSSESGEMPTTAAVTDSLSSEILSSTVTDPSTMTEETVVVTPKVKKGPNQQKKKEKKPFEIRPRVDGSHLAACHPEQYEELFAAKQKHLRELLSWSDEKPIDAFTSEKEHFRMRANFQMWHDNPHNMVPSGFFYSMFEAASKGQPKEVKSFPRGTRRINELMTALFEEFSTNEVIFRHLFEVRFLTTKKSDAESLIVLLYKKPLSPQFLEAAEVLAKKLGVAKIIGRARKQKVVTGDGDEFIQENLTAGGKTYTYFQTEGAFSQPNAGVCEKMLQWSLDVTADSQDQDLLELYCGGGTFTAPFSTNFRKVLATEVSKPSVELAQRCFKANGIENVSVVRLSSEEFTEQFLGTANYSRVHEAGIDMSEFRIGTVFVDPPRAGLDEGTCNLLSRFNKLVYISCNPETLARDVRMLADTHDLVRVAAFDQFPYTHHLEAGAVLIRKPDAPEAVTIAVKQDPPVKEDSKTKQEEKKEDAVKEEEPENKKARVEASE